MKVDSAAKVNYYCLFSSNGGVDQNCKWEFM